MARSKNTYKRSDETYEVLKNHVQPIAREYPCDDSHVYAIKNGEKNDPYAAFRHLFASCAAGGAPVEIFLRDLQGILQRFRPTEKILDIHELAGRLAEKIEAEADEDSELLRAISDRQLSRSECHRIRDAMDARDLVAKPIKDFVDDQLALFNDAQKKGPTRLSS